VNGFVKRMVLAALLDAEIYEEVEADRSANIQAFAVVLLAGVSAGMKNLFGLIHNPNRYHDDNCDPFVADVLGFPVVRRKLKLTVIDALTAQCQGGPAWMPDFAWRFDGLMASTDPVALDKVAWQLIEAQRKAKSLPSLVEAKRPPKWIATAAARGLGQADPQKFKLLRRG
jgi:uncharacterized protein (DUF362 family)